MKTVILAGGLGSRISEETHNKPKPMVEIGGRPIIWHIMQIYGHHGFDEFVIALGHMGACIKRYFLDLYNLENDLTVDMAKGSAVVHPGCQPAWKVHLVDTGQGTMTGGRILRLRDWIGDERLMLTYGDGVADIDLRALLAFHESHGRLATLTTVRQSTRYGELTLDEDRVRAFLEKPQCASWINGGFMVLEPGVFDYLRRGDETVFEEDAVKALIADDQLRAYRHDGFWYAMDTLRDKMLLESLWAKGRAAWKVWP